MKETFRKARLFSIILGILCGMPLAAVLDWLDERKRKKRAA